jgi:hypothetical protein
MAGGRANKVRETTFAIIAFIRGWSEPGLVGKKSLKLCFRLHGSAAKRLEVARRPELLIASGGREGRVSVPAAMVWLKPMSKFVLEVSPLVSALLIGAYLVSGAHEAPQAAALVAPGPELDTATLSGEAITEMVKQAHDAAAVESHRGDTSSLTAPVVQVAAVARTFKPAPRTAHAQRPAKPAHPAKLARKPVPQPLPPPSAVQPPPSPQQAAAPPEHGLLRRTWGSVTNFGGAVAHATRIDQAADAVAETPAAVARAGRKTWQAFTSILPDDPRR